MTRVTLDGISPSMGCRYKPDGQYNHAAYFSYLVYSDINFVTQEAASNNNTGYCRYTSNCFGCKMQHFFGQSSGYNFVFRGPEGNCR